MPLLSGIYDSSPIAPVAKIRENLSIYTTGQWAHYRINFIEGMPSSSRMIAEMVTISGATNLGANGTINQQILNILTLRERELLHLRFEPLDDVECILWEQSSSGRFVTRGVHTRVNLFTKERDPYLATTTFFILGMNRDMNLEVRNPNPVAVPIARVLFWGYRYMLEEIKDQAALAGIEAGRIASTWLPAEGWSGK